MKTIVQFLLAIMILIFTQPSFSQIFINPLVNEASTLLQKQAAMNSPSQRVQAQGGFPYAIPDNDPAGINIPIDMNGVFTGNVASISLVLDIEHTFLRDISATLKSPDGLATMVLFSRVNSSSSLSGEYVFSDEANNDFWEISSTSSPVPADEYRASTAGIYNSGYINNHGGCTTRLDGAFTGLTPVQSNGIWTLNISDNEGQDTGQVNDVAIVFSQDEELIFKSAFEPVVTTPLPYLFASDVLGSCQKAQFDFTGTGFSDYVTVWQEANSTTTIQMVVNDGSTSPSTEENIPVSVLFSNAEVTSGGDFDGDGIKDFVIKYPLDDESFQYLIRRSSRPDDLLISVAIQIPPVGSNFDLQIGDYDGDGLDDFAVFYSDNDPNTTGDLNIIESSTFSIRGIPTVNGITDDFRPAGGFDHNGDQVADLALFHNDGMGEGNQVVKVYDGVDGSILLDTGISFFTPIVRSIPGTFLADNHAGIGIFTAETNAVFATYNDTINSSSLFNELFVNFGMHPNDTFITGDYDGDGIDDIGYWSTTDAHFVIRPSGSSDPDNNLITVTPANAIGSDIPVANSRVR